MSLETTDARSAGTVSIALHSAEARGIPDAVATAISQLGSPPVLSLLAALLAASIENTTRAWGFALLHVLLVVLVPLAYLFALMRAGRVSDLDVFRREERWRPFLATVLGAWLAWLLVWSRGGIAELSAVSGVLALEVTVIFAVTLGWKISLHCATAAVVGAVVWKLTGSVAPFALGVPAMVWSRLVLRKHTAAQTVAGSLVGLLLVLVFFDLFAGRS